MNLKGRPRANTAKEVIFSTIDANSRHSPDGSSCPANLPSGRFVGLLVLDLYLLPQLFFACLCPAIRTRTEMLFTFNFLK